MEFYILSQIRSRERISKIPGPNLPKGSFNLKKNMQNFIKIH